MCLLLAAAVLGNAGTAMAQCFETVTFSAQACSGGNGQASSGQFITSGQTFWYNSGPTTFASLLLAGGTFRVCGDLTISSFSFTSGVLVIEDGGSLTVNGGGTLNLNGNCEIINRGTFIFNRGLNVQNANNFIWNLDKGVMDINGTLTLNNASSKIMIAHNEAVGDFAVDQLNIFTASSGGICFEAGGCISVNGSITNNVANVAQVEGTDDAGIYFNGNALLNQDWTAETNMVICLDPSSTTSGGAGWGAATTLSNCTSCEVALPVELTHFSAAPQQGTTGNLITWGTASETNNDYFLIEKSADAALWVNLSVVTGQGTTQEPQQYQLVDASPYPTTYYRLKQVDYDGAHEYSEVIAVGNTGAAVVTCSIWPNTAAQSFTISTNGAVQAVQVTNLLGAVQRVLQPAADGRYSLQGLAPGTYMVQVVYPTQTLTRRLIIQ